MGDKSKIEWLAGGATYNPIRARLKNPITTADGKTIPAGKVGWHCVHISPGCVNCYAEKQNIQCGTNPTRAGTGLKYDVPSLAEVEIYLDEKTLLQPLSWKKGRLIFPCSMTDWQADFVPDEFRDKMLAVMALTPQHTYLTLTKRADRQREYFQRTAKSITPLESAARSFGYSFSWQGHPLLPWPIRNLWLGVSTENQKYADERIPQLLSTPAAVRWVSAEPLLGPIGLTRIPIPQEIIDNAPIVEKGGEFTFNALLEQDDEHYFNRHAKIDWIVVGGESGSKARPMQGEWALSIARQCKSAGVAFFMKQGSAANWPDFKNFNSFPKELQVREYPNAVQR